MSLSFFVLKSSFARREKAKDDESARSSLRRERVTELLIVLRNSCQL